MLPDQLASGAGNPDGLRINNQDNRSSFVSFSNPGRRFDRFILMFRSDQPDYDHGEPDVIGRNTVFSRTADGIQRFNADAIIGVWLIRSRIFGLAEQPVRPMVKIMRRVQIYPATRSLS